MIALATTALLLALTTGSACLPANSGKTAPIAKDGVLDLRDWDFATDGPVNLRGAWEFYWQQLKGPEDFAPQSRQRRVVATTHAKDTPTNEWIQVPGSWNRVTRDGQTLPGEGYATFRLRVRLPDVKQNLAFHIKSQNTNFRVYVNEKLLGAQGVVGTSAETAGPRRDFIRRLVPDLSGETRIIVQISNYHDRIGGFTAPMYIGNDQLLRSANRDLEVFLCGGISIIGLYHLALFLFRREQRGRAALYFGLFCMMIVLRLLVTGERMLVQEFPDLPFWLYNRLEYLSFYAAVPLFALFQQTVFPDEFDDQLQRVVQIIAGGFCLVVIVTSAQTYDAWTLLPYAAFTALLILYAIYVLIRAIRNRRPDAPLFGLGFAILAVGVVNDLLRVLDVIHTPYMVPYAFFAFIFAQSAMIARGFAGAYRKVEHLSTELESRNADLSRMNQSFERFVPAHFLELLGKNTVSQIELGDSTLRHMSVLFTDIRSFTALSEAMSPEESFRFLNDYLQHMEPAIQKHGGFVDKFQGDAIMALFRENGGVSSADQALAAAIEMRARLAEYNVRRAESGLEPIQTGIGINTGDMMLGTVGSRNRLDTTVIGNTVNMASRLETLTAVFGSSILISDFTYKNLEEPERILMREIGAIRVRGHREPVGVYEVFAGDESSAAELKENTAGRLLFAIAQFKARAFAEALAAFEQILTELPEDRLVLFYKEQCRAYLALPPADPDWTGAIEMQVK